ncbi:MAG: glycosyltransferase family 2 protein [Atopobiaceae bacterium]|nr:glycosyltransferase family 2 protein [Atopobiaceae bacterium]
MTSTPDNPRVDAPLVSVVMPSNGCSPSLERAMRDVLGQTVSDLELIVVDDRSEDGSLGIAEHVAEEDPRVRIIRHEVNEGLSETRNTGMDAARGTWIWMPDSDDRFEPDAVERALDAAYRVEGGADCVFMGCVEEYYDEDGGFLYSNERPLGGVAYAEPEDWHGIVAALERDTLLGYANLKLYKLDRIRSLNLRFETVRLIEDILFNCAYLADARSIATCEGVSYHYAKRKGRSLTNANAYSAREYWELHERRVRTVAELLTSWGELGDARPILGSIYVRYVISALERTYHDAEDWDRASREEFLDRLFASSLYNALVPFARSEGDAALSAAIRAAKAKSVTALVAIARTASFVHEHAYELFTRIRSGR